MKQIRARQCPTLALSVTAFRLSPRKVAGRFVSSPSLGSKNPFLLLALLACLSPTASGGVSQDAYVHRKGDTWTLGTLKVQRTVGLQAGRFVTTSWKNKVNGRELIPAGTLSEELRLGVDGHEVTGTEGDWQLVGVQDHILAQGEIQLDITLQRKSLEATKSFVVYPGSSIIREWVSFKNVGTEVLNISDPGFLNLTASVGEAREVDFDWMTGGENRPGSWTLKTEKLPSRRARTFDSYDPFGGTTKGDFVGDGVLARVMLNDRQIWPTKLEDRAWFWQHRDWRYVANATAPVPVESSTHVVAGDKVVFVLNKYATTGADTTVFDPVIAYSDGETHQASEEFSNEQGLRGWRYESLQGDTLVDLVYKYSAGQWRKQGDNDPDSTFISAREMHPGDHEDVARVWIAPKTGEVRIGAEIINVGNAPIPAGGRSFHMGSSSYAPWTALVNGQNGDGVFLGWDYFGHWSAVFTEGVQGSIDVQFHLAGHRQKIMPGESLSMPKAFVGLFEKDLDNAGNESLDWQYRYLWDYTRTPWFPAIRISGWWWKGTSFWDVLNFGVESGADAASIFRKIFRVTDLMSEVGADVYHRDWGWWDRAGDWGGPDFSVSRAYLQKHGMEQLIYSYIYNVDPGSRVVREHPALVVDYGPWTQRTLDLSNPDVIEYLKKQLDEFVQRFGNFEWKTDSLPTGFLSLQQADDTPLLRQDQGFRDILQHFLDAHPDSAFQSCNAGGNGVGYEYARFSSSGSFNDDAVGLLRNTGLPWCSRQTSSAKTEIIGGWTNSTKRHIAVCSPSISTTRGTPGTRRNSKGFAGWWISTTISGVREW